MLTPIFQRGHRGPRLPRAQPRVCTWNQAQSIFRTCRTALQTRLGQSKSYLGEARLVPDVTAVWQGYAGDTSARHEGAHKGGSRSRWQTGSALTLHGACLPSQHPSAPCPLVGGRSEPATTYRAHVLCQGPQKDALWAFAGPRPLNPEALCSIQHQVHNGIKSSHRTGPGLIFSRRPLPSLTRVLPSGPWWRLRSCGLWLLYLLGSPVPDFTTRLPQAPSASYGDSHWIKKSFCPREALIHDKGWMHSFLPRVLNFNRRLKEAQGTADAFLAPRPKKAPRYFQQIALM